MEGSSPQCNRRDTELGGNGLVLENAPTDFREVFELQTLYIYVTELQEEWNGWCFGMGTTLKERHKRFGVQKRIFSKYFYKHT